MKYEKETIEEVLKEYHSGKNQLQLSKIYNIPRGTIKYWIRSK